MRDAFGVERIAKAETPAWQRSEGKNPKGGLNAKGRASARAQGMNLKAPVKAGDNPRRASFLARMGNMPGPERKPNGEPTRLLLSLQAWGASSKADAKKKAAAISARNDNVSKGLPSYLRQAIHANPENARFLRNLPVDEKYHTWKINAAKKNHYLHTDLLGFARGIVRHTQKAPKQAKIENKIFKK